MSEINHVERRKYMLDNEQIIYEYYLAQLIVVQYDYKGMKELGFDKNEHTARVIILNNLFGESETDWTDIEYTLLEHIISFREYIDNKNKDK